MNYGSCCTRDSFFLLMKKTEIGLDSLSGRGIRMMSQQKNGTAAERIFSSSWKHLRYGTFYAKIRNCLKINCASY